MIRRYRRYPIGGTLGAQQNVNVAAGTNSSVDNVAGRIQGAANMIAPGSGAILGAIGNLGGGLVDMVDKPDEYGMNSFAGSVLKGNLKAGPIGMAIAAANYSKDKAEANNLRSTANRERKIAEEQRLASRMAADPELTSGSLSASYFANGGNLNPNYMVENGSTTPLSSTASEFNGPKHSGGGIKIPDLNAEVEGGETQDGGYVYSDRLKDPYSGRTFAQAHKRVASTIGKIEGKALSPERVASLDFLREREQDLKLSQEFMKSYLGLNA